MDFSSRRHPAPRQELIEKCLVNRCHDAWRAHALSAARGHHCRGFCKMVLCAPDDARTSLPKPGMRKHLAGVDFIYAGLRQSFLGEVESPEACVLVQVAENISHLQSAAEVMRQLSTLLAFDAENSD